MAYKGYSQRERLTVTEEGDRDPGGGGLSLGVPNKSMLSYLHPRTNDPLAGGNFLHLVYCTKIEWVLLKDHHLGGFPDSWFLI